MVITNIRRLVNPGSVPENIAIICSYIAIAALFPLDVEAGTEISLHIFYIFPIMLIALHSERKSLVIGAVILSVMYQALSITLYDHLSLFSQIIVVCMVVFSDVLAACIARLLREILLEKQRIIIELERKVEKDRTLTDRQ